MCVCVVGFLYQTYQLRFSSVWMYVREVTVFFDLRSSFPNNWEHYRATVSNGFSVCCNSVKSNRSDIFLKLFIGILHASHFLIFTCNFLNNWEKPGTYFDSCTPETETGDNYFIILKFHISRWAKLHSRRYRIAVYNKRRCKINHIFNCTFPLTVY